MRLLSWLATLALLFPVTASADCAFEACGASSSAIRSWEMATLEQRLYRRVEHPSRMRALRTEIEITETRVRALQDLLVDYDRVQRFSTGNALTVSAADARVALLREEAFLRDLRERKAFEQRYHRQRKQLHAARVQQATVAATRAASLGEPRITIVNH